MRKSHIVNLRRMLYLLLTTSSFSVNAQTSIRSMVTGPGWLASLSKSYKSEVQQRIEKARERTSHGYYEKMYGAKAILEKREGMALRTFVDCSQIVCSTALPVALITFKGQRVNANLVTLNWETSTETNNAGFDIERSLTTNNFEKVGFVDGGENSAGAKKYQFPDRNSSESVSYYRLKQLDYDGKFEYSRIIAVNGFREQLTLASIPNPGTQSQGFLLVKGNDSSGKLALSVVDVKGVLVYRNDQFALGDNKQIPLSTLPELTAGLYIGNIISGNQHSTVSFVIAER